MRTRSPTTTRRPAHRAAVARVDGIVRTVAVEHDADAPAVDGDDAPGPLAGPFRTRGRRGERSSAWPDGDVIVPLVLEGVDVDARHARIVPSLRADVGWRSIPRAGPRERPDREGHRGGETIEGLLEEERRFPPLARELVRTGIVDRSLAVAAERDPEAFWAEQARTLDWIRPFSRSWTGELPHVRWFADGTLNASVNCVDRHVAAGNGDRVAFHWEGEPGDTRTITYAELLDEVSRPRTRCARSVSTRGDRVALYLPMIPELAITMLACARIGAVHSVVFGGFSANALRERIEDSACRVLVTADGRTGAARRSRSSSRRTRPSRLPVDRAGARRPTDRRGRHDAPTGATCGGTTSCRPGARPARRRRWAPRTCCSSSTRRARPVDPKGIMHTTGGYLTQASFTHRVVFDLDPEHDVYWCAADIGWVTGHSYIVYGPLANGATSVMYEGTPNFPREDRFWEIVARYGSRSSTPHRPRSARS
jgi:acetyl-CoA synthetase